MSGPYTTDALPDALTDSASPETKWGLGLKHVPDMPAENVFNFGLVSDEPRLISLTVPVANENSYNLSAPLCEFDILFKPQTNASNSFVSYITSIMGFKLSLMLTYLRFMPHGVARTSNIIVIVACILFHLTFLCIQINLCQPVSLYVTQSHTHP